MVRGTRSLNRAMWCSSSSQGIMALTASRAVRRTSTELSFRLARNTCCSTGKLSCRCSPANSSCSNQDSAAGNVSCTEDEVLSILAAISGVVLQNPLTKPVQSCDLHALYRLCMSFGKLAFRLSVTGPTNAQLAVRQRSNHMVHNKHIGQSQMICRLFAC